MSDACRRFRDDWFETTALGGASDPVVDVRHTEACDACARWIVAAQQHGRLLGELESVAAPAALDERAGKMLADIAAGISLQPRSIRALRMLPQLEAPPELEAAVFETGAEERLAEPWCAQGLRRVESLRAPAVLERLVGEELADPQAALARRFAGDLERPEAPHGLAARVRRELAARYKPSLVRAAVPFATAAAAALFVWIGLTGRGGEQRSGEYSFRVTYADSPAQLSGMAQGLASALGGGVPASPLRLERSRRPGNVGPDAGPDSDGGAR